MSPTVESVETYKIIRAGVLFCSVLLFVRGHGSKIEIDETTHLKFDRDQS